MSTRNRKLCSIFCSQRNKVYVSDSSCCPIIRTLSSPPPPWIIEIILYTFIWLKCSWTFIDLLSLERVIMFVLFSRFEVLLAILLKIQFFWLSRRVDCWILTVLKDYTAFVSGVKQFKCLFPWMRLITTEIRIYFVAKIICLIVR